MAYAMRSVVQNRCFLGVACEVNFREINLNENTGNDDP